MAATIRVDLKDQTSQGAAAVKSSLRDIVSAAGGVERSLEQAGGAAGMADSEFEELGYQVERLGGDLQELEQQFRDVEDELRQLADEARKADSAIEKIGGGDKPGIFSRLGAAATGFNQALEIGKKVAEVTGAAIDAMAERGDPAFVKLKGSLDGLNEGLFRLGESKAMQGLANAASDFVNTQVGPALSALPDLLDGLADSAGGAASSTATLFGDLQNGISNATLSAGEFFGVFADGTAQEMRLTRESRAALDEKNRALAEQEQLQRRLVDLQKEIGGISTRIADEGELQALAQLEGIGQIRAYLDDERDALEELAKQGKLTDDERAKGLQRIEVLTRRLADVEKKRAADEIQNQADANAARAKADEARKLAEAEFQQVVQQTDAIVKAAKEEQAQAAANQADAKIQELRGLIDKAGALDKARGELSGSDVGRQALKARQDAARQKVIDEGRASGEIDQNGKAVGNTPSERAQNQAELNRQIRRAQAEAEQQFRRDAAKGKVGDDEFRRAQDDLLLGRAEKSFGSKGGFKGAEDPQLTALRQQIADDQAKFLEAFKQQQANSGAFANVQAALSGKPLPGQAGGGNQVAQATGSLANATGNLANAAAAADSALQQLALIRQAMDDRASNQRAQAGRYRR